MQLIGWYQFGILAGTIVGATRKQDEEQLGFKEIKVSIQSYASCSVSPCFSLVQDTPINPIIEKTTGVKKR